MDPTATVSPSPASPTSETLGEEADIPVAHELVPRLGRREPAKKHAGGKRKQTDEKRSREWSQGSSRDFQESGLLARLAFSRKRDNSPRLMGGISSDLVPNQPTETFSLFVRSPGTEALISRIKMHYGSL